MSRCSQMSPRHEQALGKEHWGEIKPDLELPAYTYATAEAHATKWRTTKRCIDLVRPSFLNRTAGPRKQLRPTAYLDGLRGFAAFMVYWHHHQLWAREAAGANRIFENAFGHDRQYYFACLPGIRNFFTGGHYAVTVFFVISGYVLSAKPLSLIHAGEYLLLGENLSSALFRRWLRLHIPVICITFLYMTSWHAFGIWTDSKHQSNYRDELWNWYIEFKNFSFVFRTGGEPWFSYDFHVWSIPVEFRGSIVIYTALLAFSRCTRNARLLLEVGLVYYFMYIVDGCFYSMFMAGMLLCDLDMLAKNDDLPRFISRLQPLKGIIFYNLFVLSIYLGGVPSHNSDIALLRDSPGWYFLSFLAPQAVFDYKMFYLFWAAAFLVASIPHISWLRRFFETRFNQYLGRISFSLYLVHGPVLWTVADRLYAATGWSRVSHAEGLPNWINIFPMSKSGPLGFELSFLVPHLVILPFTFWLAEIVTKMFDEASVKFSQWAYKKTLAPTPKL